ncbi:MAG: hypothetical protein ACFFDU_05770 [Candidatus Thorarchaeota archaeon]
MKQFIGMIEILGEGGEMQPLHWNPNHLVDGRSILIVDEPEGIVWVWLGRGTSMLQRTTALRQARFIMKNGTRVEDTHFGTKCTTFIEVPGELKSPKTALLQKLLDTHQKTSEYLVVVKEEEKISTFEEAFKDKVEVIEQTIMPEPVRKVTPIRRRILTYEEQLATKVLFAMADCYGQATMNPIGPNEFQVSVLRLQMRFFCQGDAILFSEIRAEAQEDIEAFSRCFGQQPQLTAEGQIFIASTQMEREVTPSTEDQPVSVVESMREQLSKISQNPPKENDETKEEEQEEREEAVDNEEENDGNGGSSEFDLFG